MIEIVSRSEHWANLQIEVMAAMKSRYALALYEIVSKRKRLKFKTLEPFSVEKFREVMGVPPGKLTSPNNFKKRVLIPAVHWVNLLADFNVTVAQTKTGRKITGYTIAWEMKTDDEMREALAELAKHSTGRRARMTRKAQEVVFEGFLIDR